jgi:hypothetical protein
MSMCVNGIWSFILLLNWDRPLRQKFFLPLILNRQTSSKQIYRCPFVLDLFFLMHTCSWTMNTIRMDDDEWAYSFKVICLTRVYIYTHVCCPIYDELKNVRVYSIQYFRTLEKQRKRFKWIEMRNSDAISCVERSLSRWVWNGKILRADKRLQSF